MTRFIVWQLEFRLSLSGDYKEWSMMNSNPLFQDNPMLTLQLEVTVSFVVVGTNSCDEDNNKPYREGRSLIVP